MKIKSITDLRLDNKNANLGTDRGRKMIAESLAKYGAGRSILIDRSGRVIAGNKTLEAIKKKGGRIRVVETDGKELVVVQRTDLDLDSKKARELAIADNRTSEINLDWNTDLLKDLKLDFDLDLSSFWDDRELVQFWATPQESGVPHPKNDIASKLARKWKTRLGQIWGIGRHRLMCGDAGSKQHVASLMSKELAKVVFTSPPYFEQRNYEGKDFDWDAMMQSMSDALPADDNTQVLINLGLVHRDCEWLSYWDSWINHMRTLGWRKFGFYVWDQGSGLPGDWMGRLAPSHEFVFHFNRERQKPNKIIPTKPNSQKFRAKKDALRHPDGRIHTACSPELYGQDHKIPDSVIRINREAARGVHTKGHPAVFPVELSKFVIEAWSKTGEICYEPFSGSGTTICAAEQTDRICYGMEIEPNYVAVTLERLHEMGLKPKLLTRV
jgi:DNA modification methylase